MVRFSESKNGTYTPLTPSTLIEALELELDEVGIENFEVGGFVMKASEKLSLDELRSRLSSEMALVQNKLFSSINKNYNAFISLSTSIESADDSLGSLIGPITSFSESFRKLLNVSEEQVNYLQVLSNLKKSISESHDTASLFLEIHELLKMGTDLIDRVKQAMNTLSVTSISQSTSSVPSLQLKFVDLDLSGNPTLIHAESTAVLLLRVSSLTNKLGRNLEKLQTLILDCDSLSSSLFQSASTVEAALSRSLNETMIEHLPPSALSAAAEAVYTQIILPLGKYQMELLRMICANIFLSPADMTEREERVSPISSRITAPHVAILSTLLASSRLCMLPELPSSPYSLLRLNSDFLEQCMLLPLCRRLVLATIAHYSSLGSNSSVNLLSSDINNNNNTNRNLDEFTSWESQILPSILQNSEFSSEFFRNMRTKSKNEVTASAVGVTDSSIITAMKSLSDLKNGVNSLGLVLAVLTDVLLLPSLQFSLPNLAFPNFRSDSKPRTETEIISFPTICGASGDSVGKDVLSSLGKLSSVVTSQISLFLETLLSPHFLKSSGSQAPEAGKNVSTAQDMSVQDLESEVNRADEDLKIRILVDLLSFISSSYEQILHLLLGSILPTLGADLLKPASQMLFVFSSTWNSAYKFIYSRLEFLKIRQGGYSTVSKKRKPSTISVIHHLAAQPTTTPNPSNDALKSLVCDLNHLKVSNSLKSFLDSKLLMVSRDMKSKAVRRLDTLLDGSLNVKLRHNELKMVDISSFLEFTELLSPLESRKDIVVLREVLSEDLHAVFILLRRFLPLEKTNLLGDGMKPFATRDVSITKEIIFVPTSLQMLQNALAHEKIRNKSSVSIGLYSSPLFMCWASLLDPFNRSTFTTPLMASVADATVRNVYKISIGVAVSLACASAHSGCQRLVEPILEHALTLLPDLAGILSKQNVDKAIRFIINHAKEEKEKETGTIKRKEGEVKNESYELSMFHALIESVVHPSLNDSATTHATPTTKEKEKETSLLERVIFFSHDSVNFAYLLILLSGIKLPFTPTLQSGKESSLDSSLLSGPIHLLLSLLPSCVQILVHLCSSHLEPLVVAMRGVTTSIKLKSRAVPSSSTSSSSSISGTSTDMSIIGGVVSGYVTQMLRPMKQFANTLTTLVNSTVQSKDGSGVDGQTDSTQLVLKKILAPVILESALMIIRFFDKSAASIAADVAKQQQQIGWMALAASSSETPVVQSTSATTNEPKVNSVGISEVEFLIRTQFLVDLRAISSTIITLLASTGQSRLTFNSSAPIGEAVVFGVNSDFEDPLSSLFFQSTFVGSSESNGQAVLEEAVFRLYSDVERRVANVN